MEEKETANELMQKYVTEQEKYSHLKKDLPKKGAVREQHTLALLAKFRAKLEKVKDARNDDDPDDGAERKVVREITSDTEDDIVGDEWLSHTLRFEEKAPVLAKDASTKKDDWYDAFDPRNPLNKRKRGDEERGGHGGGAGGRGDSGGGGGDGRSSDRYGGGRKDYGRASGSSSSQRSGRH